MATAALEIDKEKSMVKSGDFTFHVLTDGYYRLDGGTMYGMVPKPIWSRYEKFDERNRLYMALNVLVAIRGDQIFLADTGVGEKMSDKEKDIYGIENDKNLIEQLKELGITPDKVTHVIPTHLHFDHAGWMTDKDGDIMFPNAKYFIQRAEWEEALNPHVRFKASYLLPYYAALKDSPNLVLIGGPVEIERDVWVYHTPGHSKGHQVVVFDTGSRHVAHLGDVAAMAMQIRLNWTCGFDRAPEETINTKTPLLEKALKEKWLVVTGHDRQQKMGEMTKEKGKYCLKKIL